MEWNLIWERLSFLAMVTAAIGVGMFLIPGIRQHIWAGGAKIFGAHGLKLFALMIWLLKTIVQAHQIWIQNLFTPKSEIFKSPEAPDDNYL